MRTRLPWFTVPFTIAALFHGASACSAQTAGGAAPAKPAAPAKIAALTIFPVELAGSPRREVGEALGLLLEQKGLGSISIAESTFEPAPGASAEETAQAFSAFVAAHPVAAGDALYAQFLVSKEGGRGRCAGIRGVVVDRAGARVWSEELTPEHPAWKRASPGEPLACCALLADRLAPSLVLGTPPGDEGPMAQLWAAKSALPPRAELDAMTRRLDAMKAKGSGVRFVVLPVRVGDLVDRAGAEALAKLLTDRRLCGATVAGDEWRIAVEGSSNEQRMLWDMARAVQTKVRESRPDADYVLFADCLPAGPGSFGAVHFTICDRNGDWVVVDSQNDHHEDFRAVDPKTIGDCCELIARRVANRLR